MRIISNLLITISIAFLFNSCHSQNALEVKDISNSEIGYVLSNIYLDNIFQVQKEGYIITIFNCADPRNTLETDFDGTGEVRQRFIFTILHDGEFTENFKVYEFTSLVGLKKDNYRVKIENGFCEITNVQFDNEEFLLKLELLD
jgi:hypothetical protein